MLFPFDREIIQPLRTLTPGENSGKDARRISMANSVRRSVCPYDCPDTCGLRVEVADGKAVKVTG